MEKTWADKIDDFLYNHVDAEWDSTVWGTVVVFTVLLPLEILYRLVD